MGNTESNVTSGVKKQAGVSTQPLYKLVNLKGGGLLVDMMKRACQNKQYAEIDHAIKTKVFEFFSTFPLSHNIYSWKSSGFFLARSNHFYIIKVPVDIFQFQKLFCCETLNDRVINNYQKFVL